MGKGGFGALIPFVATILPSNNPKLSTLFGSKYLIDEFSCDSNVYLKINGKVDAMGVNL